MFILQTKGMIITLCYPVVDQTGMKSSHKLHILAHADIRSSNSLENFKYIVWTLAWINTNICHLFTSIATGTTIKILLRVEVNSKFAAQELSLPEISGLKASTQICKQNGISYRAATITKHVNRVSYT